MGYTAQSCTCSCGRSDRYIHVQYVHRAVYILLAECTKYDTTWLHGQSLTPTLGSTRATRNRSQAVSSPSKSCSKHTAGPLPRCKGRRKRGWERLQTQVPARGSQTLILRIYGFWAVVGRGGWLGAMTLALVGCVAPGAGVCICGRLGRLPSPATATSSPTSRISSAAKVLGLERSKQ